MSERTKTLQEQAKKQAKEQNKEQNKEQQEKQRTTRKTQSTHTIAFHLHRPHGNAQPIPFRDRGNRVVGQDCPQCTDGIRHGHAARKTGKGVGVPEPFGQHGDLYNVQRFGPQTKNQTTDQHAFEGIRTGKGDHRGPGANQQ